MISINIIKEMQSVLIRQINNQNITDNEYNQMRGHLHQQLSNSFDEITKIKDFFETFELNNMYVHPMNVEIK